MASHCHRQLLTTCEHKTIKIHLWEALKLCELAQETEQLH
jgi:hypothetical protein